MSGRLKNLDKIHESLFDEEKEKSLSETDRIRKRRFNAVFTMWLDKPTLTDKTLRNYLINEFGVSKSQAYNDLHDIKYLLGNVRNAAKEWQRYKVIAMLDEAYELTEKISDPMKRSYAIVNIADKLARYTKLDKDEPESLPFGDIVPQPFEPTSDPSVIGLDPIPNLEEKIKKLNEKLNGEIEISDAKIVDNE